jgi:hypothetical protein
MIACSNNNNKNRLCSFGSWDLDNEVCDNEIWINSFEYCKSENDDNVLS